MKLAAALIPLLWAATASASAWPQFDHFAEKFVSPEGRVVEHTAGDRTTSEGQAYALFFALVANDRPLFARLLDWTVKNLAHGELATTLPAWEWGKDPHAHWTVLDRSAASDADLWLGYTLLEAARLWREPSYGVLGRALLANVLRQEVASLTQLGPMVLPGPSGFVVTRDRRWRLNPSYVPVQIARRLEALGVPGPWDELPATTLRMIRATSPSGFVPDWVVWDAQSGFGVDPIGGPVGSYDAIRVYLWAAMLDASEPLRAAFMKATHGVLDAARHDGVIPEKVDVETGDNFGGTTPPGFTAVGMVVARAAGDADTTATVRKKLDADGNDDGLYLLPGDVPRYYDQVLSLFALGFAEGRFHFGADGALQLAWEL